MAIRFQMGERFMHRFLRTALVSMLMVHGLHLGTVAYGQERDASFDLQKALDELSSGDHKMDPFTLLLNDELFYRISIGTASEVHNTLERGARVNIHNEEGFTPLSIAAERSGQDAVIIAKMLIEKGAEVNAYNVKSNDTALHRAVRFDNAPMVWFLLSQGADFRLEDENGRSARQLAVFVGSNDSLKLIDEAIQIEQERFAQERSNENMERMMFNYAYYNCAFAYQRYYIMSGQDNAHKKPEYSQEKMDERHNRIFDYRTKLLGFFHDRLEVDQVDQMAERAQHEIVEILNSMISNRNRKKKGVGKPEDLELRCKRVAKNWKYLAFGK